MFAGVDVEAVVADKTEQRDVELPGEIHGEGGGGSDGGEDGDTGHEGFLEELEAGAAGDEEDGVVGGELVVHEVMADEFVEGVVAADVFAECEEFAVVIEESGGVEAAGAVEDGLGGAEEFGEGVDDVGGDGEGVGEGMGAGGSQRFDGGFAADAAGGAGVEVAFETGDVDRIGQQFREEERKEVGRVG